MLLMTKCIMIRVIALLIMFTHASACLSQEPTFQWANQFIADPGYGSAKGIEKDADGNLIVIGMYDGFQVTLDSTSMDGIAGDTLIEGRKAYIAKFTKSGKLIWHRSLEGIQGQYSFILDMFELKIDSDGGFMVCGSYRGWCDFDPDEEEEYIVNGGLVMSTFVLKLDLNGNFDWVQVISPDANHPLNSGFEYKFGGMELDTDNNVYLAGSVKGNWDFDPDPVDTSFTYMQYPFGYDGFLVKLSSTGDFVWKQIFGSPGYYHADNVNMIKRGLDNDLYMGCTYYDSIHVDIAGQDVLLNHPPGVNDDDIDFFMSKMDTAGQIEWVTRLVGNGLQTISDLEVDENGEIYACASYTGSITLSPFVPGTYVNSNYNSSSGLLLPDACLIKYTSNGEPIYGITISSPDSDFFTEIEMDDENVYLGGSIGDSVYIGIDYVGYSEIPSDFYYDDKRGAVLKFTKSGATEWVQRFECKGRSSVSDILVDGNNLYSAGSFSDEIDFNTSLDYFEFATTGAWFNSQGFVHKMIFTTDTLNYPDFSIFPNPTNTSVNLFVQAFENTEVVIFDIQGRFINQLKLESKLTVVDLSEEASGVYLFVMQNGEKREIRRVVKE